MTSKDFDHQRLKDLEDNLAKERELLKQFEDALRYESDPRTLSKYKDNIKRQKQTILDFQKEYTELQQLVHKSSSVLTSNSRDNAMSINEKDSVEVGIIVALREEFRELMKQLPSERKAIKDEQTGVYDYHFEWSVEDAISYSCAATFIGEMGPSKASLACERFINRCQPKTIVMLGIAAGLDKDVKLGDVVLAKDVNMYLERAKIVDGQAEETFEIQPGGSAYLCSEYLLKASLNLEFAHSNIYQKYQLDSETDLSKSISVEQLDQLIQKEYIRNQAEFIDGPIASGPVVGAAKQFIKWLKDIDRNYLALEMESGGVLSSVYSHSDPKSTLILRGISDFGDDRKKELDSIGKGGIRRYAMNNTIRLLWSLLEAQVLPRSKKQ